MFFFNSFYKKYFSHDFLRLSGSWAALGLAFASFLFIGYKTLGVLKKERELSREISYLEREIGRLRDENAELDQDLGGALRDSVVERIAKSELNLQKPGEEVAIIVFSTSSPKADENIRPSFWERMRSIFRLLLP